MTDRELMQQALEALVAAYQGKDKTNQVTESITALRTALEQPEPEPVAWMLKGGHGTEFNDCIAEELKALTWKGKPMWTPLYAAPPQRKPLSLDELWRVFTRSGLSQFHHRDGIVEYKYEKCIEEFARGIEAAHGIKGEA